MHFLQVGGVRWEVYRSPPPVQVVWCELVVHSECDGVGTGLHWPTEHPQHLPTCLGRK